MMCFGEISFLWNSCRQASPCSSLDVARLAAAYAVGISRNHPFLDANKRTAIIAVELFLELNGYHFVRTDEECFDIMPRIATGEVNENDMAAWIAGGIVRAEEDDE